MLITVEQKVDHNNLYISDAIEDQVSVGDYCEEHHRKATEDNKENPLKTYQRKIARHPKMQKED